MHLSRLEIKNFRQFGETPLKLSFEPGVVALAGPNDSGKTAIIDAIRYLLTTRDQDFVGIQPEDFHVSSDGQQVDSFDIRGTFTSLSKNEQQRFIEYLSLQNNSGDPKLELTLTVNRRVRNSGRTWNDVKLRSGLDGLGPVIDSETKQYLACTYLRPLRDAEREMSSGRNSRLSQVLRQFPEIDSGNAFESGKYPSAEEISKLSLSALSELIQDLVNKNIGIDQARNELNSGYLENLSLKDETMTGEFNFTSGVTDKSRLQQILERLELTLKGKSGQSNRGRFGLGSNNLLYIACELLLIKKDTDGMRLLLVEEPEAHLHPQRQLQMLSYLRDRADHEGLQVIISTHSPVLASKVKVENIVLVSRAGAFSLAEKNTQLSSSDYKYLSRFLDATKSNLFFADHLLIVEGDAEELLLPTIASLMQCDLTKAGVSIVNVRGVGLSRYSKVFIRSESQKAIEIKQLAVKVACITDRDIMPDLAPEIIGYKVPETEAKKGISRRKWRHENDPLFGTKFGTYGNQEDIDVGREAFTQAKTAHDGGTVKTFVSDKWTLEFDLAFAGLSREVFIAVCLAKKDEAIHADSSPELARKNAIDEAQNAFSSLEQQKDQETLATWVYKEFIDGASKAVAAQYLAELLEDRFKDSETERIQDFLPSYIVKAIEYVTSTEKGGADVG